MAEYDNKVFDNMNNAVAKEESDPMLDWEDKMEEAGFSKGQFDKLFLERYFPDGNNFPDSESMNSDARYHEMSSYFDPDTYRQLYKDSDNPVGDVGAMSAKAKGFMRDMRTSVEKRKLRIQTGVYADDFIEKYDMPKEVLHEAGGFERWMRKQGLYDESNTEGFKASVQRILPGGKEGKSREFADPRVQRQRYRSLRDSNVDRPDSQKTGDY